MRNISAWAIRHPVLPVVLFVVLTCIGIVSFIRLPINQNPDIDYPIVDIFISQPGAAPSEIETQILQKVEGAVAGIGNVRNIESVASEGSAETDIEFQIGTPIDRAVTDVRDAISKVRPDLPQGIQEPQVSRVQVLGLTAVQVNQQLRDLNLNAAGGRAQVGGGEQTIRVLGGAQSALTLGDVQINLPIGGSARLRDFAEVTDGVAEVRTISRLNGRPATSFAVMKSKGASDVEVLKLVQAEIDKVA